MDEFSGFTTVKTWIQRELGHINCLQRTVGLGSITNLEEVGVTTKYFRSDDLIPEDMLAVPIGLDRSLLLCMLAAWGVPMHECKHPGNGDIDFPGETIVTAGGAVQYNLSLLSRRPDAERNLMPAARSYRDMEAWAAERERVMPSAEMILYFILRACQCRGLDVVLSEIAALVSAQGPWWFITRNKAGGFDPCTKLAIAWNRSAELMVGEVAPGHLDVVPDWGRTTAPYRPLSVMKISS